MSARSFLRLLSLGARGCPLLAFVFYPHVDGTVVVAAAGVLGPSKAGIAATTGVGLPTRETGNATAHTPVFRVEASPLAPLFRPPASSGAGPASSGAGCTGRT